MSFLIPLFPHLSYFPFPSYLELECFPVVHYSDRTFLGSEQIGDILSHHLDEGDCDRSRALLPLTESLKHPLDGAGHQTAILKRNETHSVI